MPYCGSVLPGKKILLFICIITIKIYSTSIKDAIRLLCGFKFLIARLEVEFYSFKLCSYISSNESLVLAYERL